MLGFLRSEGFDFATRPEKAEAAVINTCAFIQPAVEEAIDTILEMARMKEEGKLKKLVVAGCLVQRYGYKLLREIPEVDAWLGTGEFHRVAEALKAEISDRPKVHISRPTFLPDHTTPRAQATPFFTAYLKIAEGCSHGCSFCIIPHLRGPFRSRTLKSLVNEAERLAGQGVKELNLVAQDTTMYGRDLGRNISLEGLLEGLLRVKGIPWIRVLYCHPNGISDRLLDLVDSEERICPYLDIPFQHVNRELLKAMGREWMGPFTQKGGREDQKEKTPNQS
jgi:ribosomal protein S12 methylthiotransferase